MYLHVYAKCAEFFVCVAGVGFEVSYIVASRNRPVAVDVIWHAQKWQCKGYGNKRWLYIIKATAASALISINSTNLVPTAVSIEIVMIAESQ